MVKYVYRLIILLFVLSTVTMNVAAIEYTATNKTKVVYEITQMYLDSDGLHIKGWGFLNESQHYMTSDSIYGEFRLYSAGEVLSYPITFKYKDMSELMRLDNVSRCGENEYKKKGSQCYYEYRYVSFDEVIPYDSLTIGSKYSIQLAIYAKNSGEAYSTFILAATDESTYTSGNKTIYLNSKLRNTQFYVNHDYVYARKEAGKSGSILKSAKSDSKHGNYTYFDQYAQFYNVLGYKQIDDVTWYHVKGKIDGVKGDKYVVSEGDDYDVWIASTFIEYNGNLTTILVSEASEKPMIYTENCTIYEGDTTFNADEHVWGYDSRDGELIPVQIYSNLNINKKGNYILRYKVTNSANKSAVGSMKVKVIERPKENTPPSISAEDKIIYQNARFNYMDGVSAYDLEDGDLSNEIIVSKEIDTTILGIQEACYYVEDHEGLSDRKCINVEVIKRERKEVELELGTLRFIDINNPFVNESLPAYWTFRELTQALSGNHVLLRGVY